MFVCATCLFCSVLLVFTCFSVGCYAPSLLVSCVSCQLPLNFLLCMLVVSQLLASRLLIVCVCWLVASYFRLSECCKYSIVLMCVSVVCCRLGRSCRAHAVGRCRCWRVAGACFLGALSAHFFFTEFCPCTLPLILFVGPLCAGVCTVVLMVACLPPQKQLGGSFASHCCRLFKAP